MAAPCCETSGGQHDHRNGEYHVLAEPGGDQFHHGPMAMRVYLVVTCLVSLRARLILNRAGYLHLVPA